MDGSERRSERSGTYRGYLHLTLILLGFSVLVQVVLVLALDQYITKYEDAKTELAIRDVISVTSSISHYLGRGCR